MTAAEVLSIIAWIGSLGLLAAIFVLAGRTLGNLRGHPDGQSGAENISTHRRGAIGAAFGLAAGLAPPLARAKTNGVDASALRLRRLEDRAAIQDLITRYTCHVGRGEGAEVTALFADDAVFYMGARTVEGVAELRKFYSSLKPQALVPMVQNFLIDVDGDVARGTCKIHSLWSGSGPGFCGWYEDSFRRGPNGWLFATRKFTMHEKPSG